MPETINRNRRGHHLNHIHAKGYTGLMEMEHSISQLGAEGEQPVLEIYDAFDRF